jgi:hypothetical protein
MGWVGGIFGLALIAIAVAVGADLHMTKCQPGSFYALAALCSPQPPSQIPLFVVAIATLQHP